MCLVGDYQDNMLPAALRTSLDTASWFLSFALLIPNTTNANEYLVVKNLPL